MYGNEYTLQRAYATLAMGMYACTDKLPLLMEDKQTHYTHTDLVAGASAHGIKSTVWSLLY